MVGGSLAKRGRKGRLAMSMVIPMHKPGPDAVSKKTVIHLFRNKMMVLLEFFRQRKLGIHSCIAF